MKKLWLLPLLLAPYAMAQMTTVTGANIMSGGAPLAQGTINFTPASPAASGFHIGSLGQSTSKPTSRDVINGAIMQTLNGVNIGPLQVADTQLSGPANICYNVTVRDPAGVYILGTATGQFSGYGCVQPTGATWSFDEYIPNIPNLPLGASITNLHIQYAVIDNCTGNGCGSGGGGGGGWTPPSGSGNDFLATPADGSNGVMAPRAMVPLDVPALAESKITNLASDLAAKEAHSALATVAESGSYNDLSNKPTIPAAQVQTDWNAVSGLGVLLNKPTIPAAQIQSNWNEANTGLPDYILNKPTIPEPPFTESQVTNLPGDLAAKEAHSALATVAESGSYNDLLYLPTIPYVPDINDQPGLGVVIDVPVSIGVTGQPTLFSGWRQSGTSVTVPAGTDYSFFVGSDGLFHCQLSAALGSGVCTPSGGAGAAWGAITGTLGNQADLATALAAKEAHSALATVAESGSYNDLSNKPTIPAAQIQSDWNEANTGLLDYIKNKPTIPAGPPYTESQITNLTTDLAAKEAHSALATVAESGSYNDLSNKPTIPAAQIQSDWNEANTGLLDYIKNKPTIPAGPPYTESQITNLTTDLAAKEAHSALATVAESGSYNDLSNKPTIPAAQIQSDWNEANTGLLDYIKNKPTIPAGPPYTESQITNLTTDLAAKEAHSALATVAESGSYNDLSNNPSLWNDGAAAILKRTGAYTWGTAGYADFVALWASGSCAGFLKSDGTCGSGGATISATTSVLKGDGSGNGVAAVAGTDFTSAPDWNASSGANSIANKPAIPAAQVQTDWNAVSGLGVLLNKPTIPGLSLITFQSNLSVTTTLEYLGVSNGSSNEAVALVPMARAATLSNCALQSSAAQSSGNGLTFTMRKNGATCSGGPVLVIPTTGYTAGTVIVDSTHTCTFAAGDKLDWASSYTGTPTTEYPVIQCEVQ